MSSKRKYNELPKEEIPCPIDERLESKPNKTVFKIMLLGDCAVGKSSYFSRHCSDKSDYKFNKNYDTTQGWVIGKSHRNIGQYDFRFDIFDMAGQEQYEDLRENNFYGVDAIFLFYAVNNRKTKQSILTKWIPEIKKYLDACGMSNIPIAVIGNKYDLIDIPGCEVEVSECTNIRTPTLIGTYDEGPIRNFNISVKSGYNMYEPLTWVAQTLIKPQKKSFFGSYKQDIVIRPSSKKSKIQAYNWN